MKIEKIRKLEELGPYACATINEIELYFDECFVGDNITTFYMNGTQIATIKTNDIKKIKNIM